MVTGRILTQVTSKMIGDSPLPTNNTHQEVEDRSHDHQPPMHVKAVAATTPEAVAREEATQTDSLHLGEEDVKIFRIVDLLLTMEVSGIPVLLRTGN